MAMRTTEDSGSALAAVVWSRPPYVTLPARGGGLGNEPGGAPLRRCLRLHGAAAAGQGSVQRPGAQRRPATCAGFASLCPFGVAWPGAAAWRPQDVGRGHARPGPSHPGHPGRVRRRSRLRPVRGGRLSGALCRNVAPGFCGGDGGSIRAWRGDASAANRKEVPCSHQPLPAAIPAAP